MFYLKLSLKIFLNELRILIIMIEAVVFDWGGVLMDNPAPCLIKYCAEYFGVDKNYFKKVFSKYVNPFLTASVSEDYIWKNICEKLEVEKPKTSSLWKDAFRACYSPKKEVFELIAELHKKRYKTALLSNTEIPAVEFFKEQNYDIFDKTVFSCLERIKKPHKKIYKITCKKLGVKPKNSIFIDDKFENVNGAFIARMKGILFENYEQLRKELSDYIKL